MSRKRVLDEIKEELNKKGLSCVGCKEVVGASIDGTIEHMLSFAQEVAQELVGVGLYSEAMVAGVIVRKLKSLKIDNP